MKCNKWIVIDGKGTVPEVSQYVIVLYTGLDPIRSKPDVKYYDAEAMLFLESPGEWFSGKVSLCNVYAWAPIPEFDTED